jgi:hypothetical protein
VRSRALWIAPALLALAALVAVATRADRPGRAGGEGGARHADPGILLEYLILIVAVGAVAGLAIFVSGVWRPYVRERGLRKGRRNWLLSSVITIGALLATVTTFVVIRTLRHDGSGGPLAPQPPTSPLLDMTRSTQGKALDFSWTPVIVVGSIVLAGALAVSLLLLRRRTPHDRSAHAAEVVAASLDDSIDDLLAERDPRRAVIAAYARMERAFAAVGFARRPAEAPHEYLERTLTLELGAGTVSVGRLTRLFERAKFSEHAIDATMRTDAVGALTVLRDELRALA